MIDTQGKQFFIRSDGTFQAHMGDVLLKAEKVGKTEGYHFEAIASTPDKDRDDETLVQKGLNFEPFKEHGEFNWNHVSHAMVGVPVGKKAWYSSGSWHCEGMILKGLPISENYTTDMVIQQHNALKKAGFNRGLCCSVEGKVIERSDDGKYVLKADIYNIALTFRPVNPNCTVAMLAKSLNREAALQSSDDFYKALAGQDIGAFVREDLEGASSKDSLEDRLVKHLMRKGYSQADAKRHVSSFFSKKFRRKS